MTTIAHVVGARQLAVFCHLTAGSPTTHSSALHFCVADKDSQS